ncbi:enoyl-CoA hydratase-related protein [Fusibacter sp. 3D3]|uniref:enoyl-CoA hydratase-related protein n=1 Tax=Fusibacter sp. 3D3 TaxID=1048380 RepID=UPI000852AA92|nr:enoyl-CoA hydratase-related protein [Fusibacter sp. 3D3]GAU76423.1 enoyl-CoA hydratase [Fusibacter sp. 3D3]
MTFSKISYEVNDSVAVIALNSPKNLNAFDELMIDDVLTALEKAEADASIRVVVIKGNGPAFSAGGDIGMMYKGIKSGDLDLESGVQKIALISVAIKKFPKPVIASVHNAVAGAAFNIALACDFCIASEDTKFIQAFVNIGLIPDAGGLYLLGRAVGVNRAIQLGMTGKPVLAKEAQMLGFVSEVCSKEELEEATAKMAQKIASGPAQSYKYMKELIYQSQFADFESYIKAEVMAQSACSQSSDFKEGVSAFVEKRKPLFG